MKDSEFSRRVEQHKTPPPPPKPTPAERRKSYGPPATREQIIQKLTNKGFIEVRQGSFSRR
jgi:DNA topoisomerase IA